MALANRARFVVWLAGALAALSGCRSCGSHIPSGDAGDEVGVQDGGHFTTRAAAPPFRCGVPPGCVSGGELATGAALARDIRSRVARGAFEEATAMLACARARGDDLRVEADPGFDSIELSHDSTRLFDELEAEGALRVFDIPTGIETMRIEDVQNAHFVEGGGNRWVDGFRDAVGGFVIAPSRAGGPRARANAKTAHLWNLHDEVRVDASRFFPGDGAIGTSSEGHWIWGVDRSTAILVHAEDLKNAAARPLVLRVALPSAPSVDGLEVIELGAPGRLAISDRRGRYVVVDESTGATVRTFTSRGTLALVVGNASALVFEDGAFLSGMDDPVFDPQGFPELVMLDDARAAPVRLSAPACARSMALTASPDGTTLLTRSRTGLCAWDIATRKLLETMLVHDGYSMRKPEGVFVGNALAVVDANAAGAQTLFSAVAVAPRGQTPVLKVVAAVPNGTSVIDPPQDLRRFSKDHAIVTTRTLEGAASLVEVRSDGTTHERATDVEIASQFGIGSSGLFGGVVIPQRGLVVGGTRKLDGVVACETTGDKPCWPLPLGGSTKVTPDGRYVAGPAKNGAARFGSPAFTYGARGSLAIVDPQSAHGTRHDAPGFRAATFTASGELALFGDDGMLVTCGLPAGPCRTRARSPLALVIPAEPGVIATVDATLHANGEPAPAILPESLKKLTDRYEQDRDMMRRGASVVHTGRSLLVTDGDRQTSVQHLDGNGVTLQLAATSCLVAIDASGHRVACVGASGFRVYDADSASLLYEETWPASPILMDPDGAAAFTPDGSRVAYVAPGRFAIIDIAAKRAIFRQKVTAQPPRTLAIAPDGQSAAFIATSTSKTDERVSELLIFSASSTAPERVTIPAATRRRYDATSVALQKDGYFVARWPDGGVLLVDAQRRISTLARAPDDGGVWLVARGRATPLGDVRRETVALTCRSGVSVLPASACLPLVCDRATAN